MITAAVPHAPTFGEISQFGKLHSPALNGKAEIGGQPLKTLIRHREIELDSGVTYTFSFVIPMKFEVPNSSMLVRVPESR